MINIANLSIKLLVIVFAFVAAIAMIYILVLPMFFHGYKTYIFLVLGVIGAALLGAYYCYKATDMLMSAFASYFLSSLCGLIVAALVLFLSLLIIVNVKGS